MTHDTPQYLTRRQAADRAGVHLRTVARWLADGALIKHTAQRGRVLVDAAELDAFLAPQPVDGTGRTHSA